jgi:hypothetical protein
MMRMGVHYLHVLALVPTLPGINLGGHKIALDDESCGLDTSDECESRRCSMARSTGWGIGAVSRVWLTCLALHKPRARYSEPYFRRADVRPGCRQLGHPG